MGPVHARVVANDPILRDELLELLGQQMTDRSVRLQEAMAERLLYTAAEAGVNRYVLLVLVEHEGAANALRYLFLRLADRHSAEYGDADSQAAACAAD